MKSAKMILAGILAGTAAEGGDLDGSARNAISDIARAERDQAQAIQRIERTQREQARRTEHYKINA